MGLSCWRAGRGRARERVDDLGRLASHRAYSAGRYCSEELAEVARSGAGTRAAPTITRPNASTRPITPTAPEPIGSPKTSTPPTIAERLAATDGDRDHLDRLADLQAARGRVEGDHERDQRGERPWAEQAEHRSVGVGEVLDLPCRQGCCSLG
jgi:hypothetical protein